MTKRGNECFPGSPAQCSPGLGTGEMSTPLEGNNAFSIAKYLPAIYSIYYHISEPIELTQAEGLYG